MSDYYNAMDREHGIGLPANKIGFTAIPNKDQLDELKAKIRLGVSKLELGFMGAGKSTGEAPSPEMYGKEERNEIRELAKVNKVELSTHASFRIAPLSGFSKEGFEENVRKDTVDEIKRAIDFAADVAEGGPVVVHLGEFQRPVSVAEKEKFSGYEYETTLKDAEGKTEIKKRSEEAEATVMLADEKTGRVFGIVKKDQPLFMPEFEKDPKTNKPVLNESGNPAVKGKADEAHTIEKLDWNGFKKKYNFDSDDEAALFVYKVRIGEKEAELEGAIAREKYYKEHYYNNLPEEEKKKMQAMAQRSIDSYEQQKERVKEEKANIQPISIVGTQKTAQSLAELGMYAIEQEKKKNLDKPLYVAPENIFPETYGGHPDEMKELVIAGRKRMAEMLQKKGYSGETAEKLASSHIKATFDIGHAFTWKRFFNGDDKKFSDWLIKKVEELRDEGVLGHIHITDNFGYHDEHLPPGQGTAPIKEVIDRLKKANVDFVVEGGRENEKVWTEALKEFGSPIYGISRPNKSDPWDVIEHSYFGRTAPPYFVVGEYSQEMGERVAKDFSSWAGIPFE
jgi:sugar phosphate isomerase/epimerase